MKCSCKFDAHTSCTVFSVMLSASWALNRAARSSNVELPSGAAVEADVVRLAWPVRTESDRREAREVAACAAKVDVINAGDDGWTPRTAVSVEGGRRGTDEEKKEAEKVPVGADASADGVCKASAIL